MATPSGFEPPISALTGRRVWPLHHGAASASPIDPTDRWHCSTFAARQARLTPLKGRCYTALRRSVAQLEEQRSPKPQVVGSSPSTPAIEYIAEVVKLADTRS